MPSNTRSPTATARLVRRLCPLRRVIHSEALGYPVVLKTAMPGIAHKSDVGGVKLDIRDSRALSQAYSDMSERLGAGR